MDSLYLCFFVLDIEVFDGHTIPPKITEAFEGMSVSW
jgi:hypothetical protein